MYFQSLSIGASNTPSSRMWTMVGFPGRVENARLDKGVSLPEYRSQRALARQSKELREFAYLRIRDGICGDHRVDSREHPQAEGRDRARPVRCDDASPSGRPAREAGRASRRGRREERT